MAQPLRGPDIVISGLSGRYPESSNVAEFAEKLFAGEDLVTENDRRWEPGYFGLPVRHGKLKEINRFDATFFGIPSKLANIMDPQLRMLLEVCYEAILDAGVDPAELRGSRTGVFVGCSGSETQAALTQDPDTVTGYTMVGCFMSMFANRLSFAFDLRGPSFPVDTACSSGLLAMQLAVDAMRKGDCDAAIVCASSITLTPTGALQFLRYNMLSPSGASRSFDASGDGYARSEAVSAVLLQQAPKARRSYATIVHAKSNTDGYKSEGITFPSGVRQSQLLSEVYDEANVDPSSVVYVEAHGTGTPVGDPQEASAIAAVLCPDGRPTPLLIGSVKSNMGHAEPASGLAALSKVIIAIENGFIPPNLHFEAPNPEIPSLIDGRMRVVTEKTAWEGGLIGINSFGFGGANTHVLLRSPLALPVPRQVPDPVMYPKLICVAGRTVDGVEQLLDSAEEHADNAHYHSLLLAEANLSSNHCPYRGYTVLNRPEGPLREVQKVTNTKSRPIWFIYSGMGTQWPGMGADLLCIPQFQESIRKSADVLRPFGLDIEKLLVDGTEEDFKNTMHCTTSITAIQMALTDLLHDVGVEADGLIGHSTGEMACGYADGSLTRDQTMLIAYHRGREIVHAGLNQGGGMAAVGLSWAETKRRLPATLTAACYNAADSVTVSGPEDEVRAFVEELKAEDIFARFVNTSGVPFHSPPMRKIEARLGVIFGEIVSKPKPRSLKWVSSSVPQTEASSELARMNSAAYQINNIVSPVLFHEAVQKIPEGAITVEVAPHCLLQAVLRRSLSGCTNVGLMKARHDSSVDFLLQSIGRLHQAGAAVHLNRFYPAVTYPVPRGTPMLGPLVQQGWDHATEYFVVSGKDMAAHTQGSVATSCSYTVDPFNLEDTEFAYILDHVIDGRCLFPFTGHVFLAWKAFCKLHSLDLKKTEVIFEDIVVHRPTIVTRATKFDVILMPSDGTFHIVESGSDSAAASGRVRHVDEPTLWYYDSEPSTSCPTALPDDAIELDAADVYKELLLRGYEYGHFFRCIYSFADDATSGQLLWNDNWVTFLDGLLQSLLLVERDAALRLPMRLRYLRIDPVKLLECVTPVDDVQVVAVSNDAHSNGCFAGGVEMRDLHVQTAPRRAQQSLVLERVFFVEHHDDRCLLDYPKESVALTDYAEVCIDLLCSALGNQWGAAVLEVLPSGQTLKAAIQSLNNTDPPNQNELECWLNDQQCSALHLLHEALNPEHMGECHELSSAAKLVLAQLPSASVDKLLSGATLLQRPLKPILDIALENQPSHTNRICSLDPVSLDCEAYVTKLAATHPLIETDMTVFAKADSVDCKLSEQFDVKVTDMDIDAAAIEQLSASQKNFDIMILNQILSRKADIDDYLLKAKEFLKPEGFAIVVEVTSRFELAFAVNCLSNVTPPSMDDATRHYGTFKDHHQWLDTFEKAGLIMVAHQTDPALMSTVYLLRRVPEEPKVPIIVEVDDVTDFKWLEPVRAAIENPESTQKDTVWLTSSAVRDNGVVGLANCLREEGMPGNRIRTIVDVSIGPKNGPMPVSPQDPVIAKTIAQDLHSNTYRDGKWGSYRHMVVTEGALISQSVNENQSYRRYSDNINSYSETEHAFINSMVRGDLNSLSWVEGSNRGIGPTKDLQRLHVYYAALNFRDIMLATGKLLPDAIPQSSLTVDRECMLGVEYAGRLENGKRLMGILPAQAMATTIWVNPELLAWEVPRKWSLEQAATIPIVYTTAYYALNVRGNLAPGEKLLIHSGSGGVGQAAIAIALAMGCEVFTTVSSMEKRAALQQRYPQLRDEHFSNSRTCEFERHIMRLTGGRGVDVVLNSLADDKLRASIRCLAVNGRFLEIGKVDLANNTALGMGIFLRNVSFHGILPDAIFESTHHDWHRVVQLMNDGIREGVVRPLPATVFSSDQVEDAFRYMAQGKHIGKVVLQIRNEEPAELTVPRPITVHAVRRTRCHPDHVYLLTGGLGGFGLELTEWLIKRGATKVVLTSRSGIRTGYQARCVNHWRKLGVQVVISKLDVAEADETEQLIKLCQNNGPLGGLFHLAMLLRDCLFENQSAQNFKDSARAKYWGTRNLDAATRKLCGEELKWFVAFSSVSCGRGNAGQTNYGWSNGTMERVVELRRADGHPAIAIQWGAVGDVGVVLETLGDNTTVVGGTLPQRMPSCLAALDTFLSWDHPIVSSYVRADTGRKKEVATGGDILATLARILGVSDASQLNLNASLADFGLDSLMGVEIKQALERDYDLVLSMKDIRSMSLLELKAQTDAHQSPGTRSSAKHSSASLLDVEQQMQQLFKLRIDVNDLLATDVLVRLNETETGPRAFFVHSIEGIATPLQRLAGSLDCPVYVFQCTPGVPLDSIELMAEHYLREMREVQPEPPYNLVGYSYGACIAFEMATQLQQQCGRGAVRSLVLLDGSHHYMQTYRKVYRSSYSVQGHNLTESPLFETEILCALLERFVPDFDYPLLRQQLLSEANWPARLEKAVAEVMLSTTLFKNAETVSWACEALRAKFLCADKFDPQTNFDGDVVLIRAATGAGREQEVGDDYGLGEVVTGTVEVCVVEGDHDTIVQGDSHEKTAEIIMGVLAVGL